MSVRLNLAKTSVSPFEFPALGERNAPVAEVDEPDGRWREDADPAGPAAILDADGAPLDDGAAMTAAAVAEARAEGLQSGLEEGRREGYADGFAQGVRDGEASLADAAHRLAAIVSALGAPMKALERPVEEGIVALALEVARCVIGGEVKRSHEFLVQLVRQAIAKVPLDMGTPRVLLNPVDLDLVRQLIAENDLRNAALVGDETIEAGGCLVVADGDNQPIIDRRWNVRAVDGVSQVNLTLPSRWREVMLTLFDGEDE